MSRIRLIHFADIHIGMEKYGDMDPATGINNRVLDFLGCINEVIDYGLEHEVDLVIFAGDVFRTHNPTSTYQRAFARCIKRLADEGVPTILLIGNHDLPMTMQQASSIDIFHTLDVPNVIVGQTEDVHLLETRRGLIQVATIPYPVRQRLMSYKDYKGISLEEVDRQLQNIVANNIRALATQLIPDIPAVLTAHLSVSGAAYGSEQSVIFGRDLSMLKSTLSSPAWDYVALGHIHKHQSLNENKHPPIVYSGSLERIDFGEERGLKGFCWVELARGDTNWKFIQVDARHFVTIRADLRESSNPLVALQQEISLHSLEGSIVRLLLRLRADQVPQMHNRDVHKLLSTAHFIGPISHDVERKKRQTWLRDSDPTAMTDRELLTKYLEAKDLDSNRVEMLLKRAKRLMVE